MVIVSNGETTQTFECLQAVVDFFGQEEGNAISQNEHSQITMTLGDLFDQMDEVVDNFFENCAYFT